MASRRRFKEYGIRPKGSPEVGFDPFVLTQLQAAISDKRSPDREQRNRVAKVFNFIIKTALVVLPPQQRKIFYSVWVRSDGKMSKGVMEYSRKMRKNHFTEYNNFYKASASLKKYLDNTGYTEKLIAYLHNGSTEGDRP